MNILVKCFLVQVRLNFLCHKRASQDFPILGTEIQILYPSIPTLASSLARFICYWLPWGSSCYASASWMLFYESSHCLVCTQLTFFFRALLHFYSHLFTMTFAASRFLSNLRVQHLTLLSVNKYLYSVVCVHFDNGTWWVLIYPFWKKESLFCCSLSESVLVYVSWKAKSEPRTREQAVHLIADQRKHKWESRGI